MWDRLDDWLDEMPAAAAVERLASELQKQGDLASLFQAWLLGERMRLGLPAVMPADDEALTRQQRDDYEEAIRVQARRIGQLFLDRGDIPGAWPYFRLIGELAPLAMALEQLPLPSDDAVELALHLAIAENVHPVWGYRLLLERRGVCSAITQFGQRPPPAASARHECLQLIIQHLHDELRERLRSDVATRAGLPAADLASASVAELLGHLAGRETDDWAHLDVSHLGSVLQYAVELPRGTDFEKLLDLCRYGERLPQRWQPVGDPPFESGCVDYLHFFRTLAGQEVERGLEHFRAKAETYADQAEVTAPGEVVVHLLAELGRPAAALEAYGRYLSHADRRALTCISAEELSRRCGGFAALAGLAQRRGDLVGYAAARLAELGKPAEKLARP
ncbi:MAG TPA: hypothetical protein PKD86_06475 [Gemmatales bacterium]|nr:hypothetical protein [Gemmatales bacterium]HMP58982.1 hypothetical protein [Gemmatales bacterium]